MSRRAVTFLAMAVMAAGTVVGLTALEKGWPWAALGLGLFATGFALSFHGVRR